MTYDFPLNEKSRTYLRLEALFAQIQATRALEAPWSHIAFFKGLFDLQELLEYGDVRLEVMKDLDRLATRVTQWAQLPLVDLAIVRDLQSELSTLHQQLRKAARPGSQLKEDRLLIAIRQRFSIPGGLCTFDLPQLHHWLKRPALERAPQVQGWLADIKPLMQAISLVLKLWRECSAFNPCQANGGIYQNSANQAHLVRAKVPMEHAYHPTLSGHKNRFVLRFISTSDAPVGDVNFSIACC
ncbi:MAG: cell division protein ZapD [Aeromonas sp.]